MNRNEILEKSRQENKGGDEREKRAGDRGAFYGMIGMCVVFVILVIVNISRRDYYIYDMLAIIDGALAANYIYQLFRLRKLSHLVNAIIWSAATVIWIVLHIRVG